MWGLGKSVRSGHVPALVEAGGPSVFHGQGGLWDHHCAGLVAQDFPISYRSLLSRLYDNCLSAPDYDLPTSAVCHTIVVRGWSGANSAHRPPYQQIRGTASHWPARRSGPRAFSAVGDLEDWDNTWERKQVFQRANYPDHPRLPLPQEHPGYASTRFLGMILLLGDEFPTTMVHPPSALPPVDESPIHVKELNPDLGSLTFKKKRAADRKEASEVMLSSKTPRTFCEPSSPRLAQSDQEKSDAKNRFFCPNRPASHRRTLLHFNSEPSAKIPHPRVLMVACQFLDGYPFLDRLQGGGRRPR